MKRFVFLMLFFVGGMTFEGYSMDVSKDAADYAKEAYTLIRQSCVYPTHQVKSRDDYKLPKGFSLGGYTHDTGNRLCYTKTDENFGTHFMAFFTPPSEGQNPYVIDCNLAFHLATIYTTWKKFPESEAYLNKTGDLTGNNAQFLDNNKLTKVMGPIRDAQEAGVFGYIANHKAYTVLSQGHPSAAPARLAAGENVVSCGFNDAGKMTYMIYDPTHKRDPMTYEQIRELLIDHLLNDPIDDEDPSARQIKRQVQGMIQNTPLKTLYDGFDACQQDPRSLMISGKL
ncbi:MAG: hypothetical protein K2X98_05340 [Alphaproteobacteria bacterium]|nr:hypothetical protein [Alphaproteobacteria bacterium]